MGKVLPFLYRCSTPRCKNLIDKPSDFRKGEIYICQECAEKEKREEKPVIFLCQIYKRDRYGEKTNILQTQEWYVHLNCRSCGYDNHIDDEPYNLRYCPRCGSKDIELED